MSILVIRSLTSIQNYIGIILCSCFYCSDIRIVVVIQFITGCSPSNHSAVLGFLSLISAQSYDIVVVYVACTKVGRCLLSVSVAGVANQCILFVCTLIGYDILDGLVHIGALNVYRCADCSCNVSIIVIVLCSYVQDDIVCSSLLQILCRDVIISLYRIGYCNLGSFCRNTLRNKVLAGQTALVGNNAGPAAVCAGEAAKLRIRIVSGVGINHTEVVVIFRILQCFHHGCSFVAILDAYIHSGVVLVSGSICCQCFDGLFTGFLEFGRYLCIIIPRSSGKLAQSLRQLLRSGTGNQYGGICLCTLVVAQIGVSCFHRIASNNRINRNGLGVLIHGYVVRSRKYLNRAGCLLGSASLGSGNGCGTHTLCHYVALAVYRCNSFVAGFPGNALVVESCGTFHGCLQRNLLRNEHAHGLLAHCYGLGLQILYFNLDGLLCFLILLGGCCNLYSSLLLSGYVAGFGNGGNLLVAALPFNGLACLGRFCFINRYLYFTLDIHCGRSGLEVNLLWLLCCRICGNRCHRHGQCHAQCQHDGEHFLRTFHVQIPPSFINTIQLIEGAPPFAAFQKRNPYAIIITIFQ